MSTKFNEFDILFHNFFYPTSGFGSAATTKQPHPLNIFYDDNGLHFEVACTGLTKDEVNVDIEDDILKISYNKAEEEKELPDLTDEDHHIMHHFIEMYNKEM
jgi:HSP20 family molecular chaperone IbpA